MHQIWIYYCTSGLYIRDSPHRTRILIDRETTCLILFDCSKDTKLIRLLKLFTHLDSSTHEIRTNIGKLLWQFSLQMSQNHPPPDFFEWVYYFRCHRCFNSVTALIYICLHYAVLLYSKLSCIKLCRNSYYCMIWWIRQGFTDKSNTSTTLPTWCNLKQLQIFFRYLWLILLCSD